MTTQTTLVDTVPLLHQCLLDIAPSTPPATGMTISIDVEGIKLCRIGRVCIVQVHVSGSSHIWLLDIVVLGQQAFDATDARGKSVKGVFEDPAVKKLLYDVRNDSDALYNLHGVYLRNVSDVQLLELAVRYHTHKWTKMLNGLKRTLDTYLILPQAVARVKEDGRALFDPNQGGSDEIFARRPLDPRLVMYCALDVAVLAALEEILLMKLGEAGRGYYLEIVDKVSWERVALAKDAGYNGRLGEGRALAPVWKRPKRKRR